LLKTLALYADIEYVYFFLECHDMILIAIIIIAFQVSFVNLL